MNKTLSQTLKKYVESQGEPSPNLNFMLGKGISLYLAINEWGKK